MKTAQSGRGPYTSLVGRHFGAPSVTAPWAASSSRNVSLRLPPGSTVPPRFGIIRRRPRVRLDAGVRLAAPHPPRRSTVLIDHTGGSRGNVRARLGGSYAFTLAAPPRAPSSTSDGRRASVHAALDASLAAAAVEPDDLQERHGSRVANPPRRSRPPRGARLNTGQGCDALEATRLHRHYELARAPL